jgi:hypothetical protein
MPAPRRQSQSELQAFAHLAHVQPAGQAVEVLQQPPLQPDSHAAFVQLLTVQVVPQQFWLQPDAATERHRAAARDIQIRIHLLIEFPF